MKQLISFLMAILACHLLNAETKRGGGDRRTSTREEVIQALELIKMDALFGELFRARSDIKDARLKEIFSKMFELTSSKENFADTPISKKIESTTLMPVENQGCLDEEKVAHGASVTEHGICISIEDLKKVSPGNLIVEIVGLLAHEFTHVMGYDEPEAILVQNLFLKNGKRIFYRSDDLSLVVRTVGTLKLHLGSMLRELNNIHISNYGFKREACGHLLVEAGKMALADQLISQKRYVNVGQWGERYKTTDEQVYLSASISTSSTIWGMQCFDALKSHESVDGEWARISRGIKLILEKVEVLEKSLDIEIK